jgi:hypothetical protein
VPATLEKSAAVNNPTKPTRFPGGKRFAFTIIDDTDCATVANVRPFYDLLHDLGMRTTKTIWPLPGHHPDDPNDPAQPVTDPEYVEFIHCLQEWGFEIALHNVRSYSSRRQEIEEGLATFRQMVGRSPRVHANHMFNQDGLYWGDSRLDFRPLAWAYRTLRRSKRQPESKGHIEGSSYFWGDLCRENIEYVRGFTFPELNTLKMNPTMPYYDARRPYVRAWFSGTEAMNVREFKSLMTRTNRERLEAESGVCIVATHIASGYVSNGRVDPEAATALKQLARRPGWFVPVSELLDHLVDEHSVRRLPWWERHRMQIQWTLSRLLHRRG